MAANLASLLSSTTLSENQSTDITWTRRSFSDLRTIRSLSSSAKIGFFTPAISPPPGSPGANMDPFEPLGRALGTHHSNIQHVPYVLAPGAGLTDVHEWVTRKASVLVIVVCVLDDGAAGTARWQTVFVDELTDWMKSWNIKIPMVLVKIGTKAAKLVIDDFRNEITCGNYSLSALEGIAWAIMRD